MKILQPLTSVLIVGLLSYTVAQEEIPNHQNLIETLPARLERSVGNRFRRSCSPSVGFLPCGSISGNDRNITSLFSEICSDLPQLTSCKRTFATCLSQEQRRSLDIFYDILTSVLTYACQHRDATEKFLNGGGIQCPEGKYATHIQPRCANKLFNSSKFHDIKIDSIWRLPKLNNDTEGCTFMQNHKQCVVEQLNECSTSRSAGDFVNDAFSYALGEIHCSQAPPAGGLANATLSHAQDKKKTSSQAPPALVVNVLSIIAAIVISLRFA